MMLGEESLEGRQVLGTLFMYGISALTKGPRKQFCLFCTQKRSRDHHVWDSHVHLTGKYWICCHFGCRLPMLQAGGKICYTVYRTFLVQPAYIKATLPSYQEFLPYRGNSKPTWPYQWIVEVLLETNSNWTKLEDTAEALWFDWFYEATLSHSNMKTMVIPMFQSFLWG